MKRTKFGKCECGCGKRVTKKENRFLPSHNLRVPLDEEAEKKRREKISKTMTEYLKDNPEERKRRAEAARGRTHTKEARKKMSKKAKEREKKKKEEGWTMPEEARKKIGDAHRGRKRSEETKKKLRKAHKGKTISEEQRKQISETLKKHYKNNSNPFKGKSHSEKSKQKMSESLKGKYSGEKASNWQGGISCLPYAPGWTPEFIESIRKRDNHTCQNPKCKDPHEMLDVHHIDYDKQNHSEENLITLCKRCHGRTQKNRKYWIKYYQKIMQNRDL